MMLKGVIAPRDERPEVFVFSLRSNTKCVQDYDVTEYLYFDASE